MVKINRERSAILGRREIEASPCKDQDLARKRIAIKIENMALFEGVVWDIYNPILDQDRAPLYMYI